MRPAREEWNTWRHSGSRASGFWHLVSGLLPHGGVRPCNQKATCLKQLTLGPYVEQMWSRSVQKFEPTTPANPTVWFGYPVSGFGYPFTSKPRPEYGLVYIKAKARIWPVSGFGFRVSGFGFRVSGFGNRVSGLGYRVSGFGFRVSVFGLRVSCFGCRVSGFGFRVSGFWLRVSGTSGRGVEDVARPVESRRAPHVPAP